MLTLRPATMDDAERLFAWRNDPVTRANCIHSAEVVWPRHVAWLSSTLGNRSRRLLIVERNGVPAATARFDYNDPTEFNFSIAPQFRCGGSSLAIARLALAAEPACVAYIKRENRACQRLLQACGGRLVQDGDVQLWDYRSNLGESDTPVAVCPESKR